MKQFRREMAKLSSIQKNLNRLRLIEKFNVKRVNGEAYREV